MISSYILIVVNRTIEFLYLQQYLRRWSCTFSPKSVIAMERFQRHQMSSTTFIPYTVWSKTHLYLWWTLCCRASFKTRMIKFFNCLKKLGTKIIVDFEAAVPNAIEKKQPDCRKNSILFLLPGPGSLAQCTKNCISEQVHRRWWVSLKRRKNDLRGNRSRWRSSNRIWRAQKRDLQRSFRV